MAKALTRRVGVSWDLWDTLICHSNKEDIKKIKSERVKLLSQHLGVNETFVEGVFNKKFYEGIEFISSPESIIEGLVDKHGALDADIKFIKQALSLKAIENAVIELAPNVFNALQELSANCNQVLISNTKWTSGDHLERVLGDNGVDHFFLKKCFSDQVGIVKPDPKIFENSWHGIV